MQRPSWWQPTVIGLIFLFIVGWFVPFGEALIVASLVCGVILSWLDQRARHEFQRARYLARETQGDAPDARAPADVQ